MKRNIYYDNENISDTLAANIIFSVLPAISQAIELLDDFSVYPPYIIECIEKSTNDKTFVIINKNKKSVSIKIIKEAEQ